MILSDVSVKRPVFAIVLALLLVTFGLLSYQRLQVRELPDINPPIVSVETTYSGASAEIVEVRVTQLIEDSISGIEGIRFIESESSDGLSQITVEFNTGRDIDNAANDVRDRVSRILDDLPEETDPPEIFKVDANTDVILWMNLASDTLDQMYLTDYAERYLVDRFSVIDGVARVRVGGGRRYAMRIWLDRYQLAAHDITVNELEQRLREQNVELPAGRVESVEREFTVRIDRLYRTPEEFASLVLSRGMDGHLVRLGDVAHVEIGPEDDREGLRGNGQEMVGLGIIQQSQANLLSVARAVKAELAAVQTTLPPSMRLFQSSDSSFFIEEALKEVYVTLGLTMGLVILVIFVFIGDLRATLVPAVTVPVSIVSAFTILYIMGFSVNLLTLLAFVLAIGLAVDDSIVVLENIERRVENGEPPLAASYLGARQVAFAVIVTTITLVAVFVPIGLLEGNIGRLFTEFAFAMAGAVCVSTLVALSLSPMMCSKLLRPGAGSTGVTRRLGRIFRKIESGYRIVLGRLLQRRALAGLLMVATAVVALIMYQALPKEFAPLEDRARFFVLATMPEGSSLEYTKRHMLLVEEAMLPFTENGDLNRALIRWPRSFASTESVNTGIGIAVLSHWDDRDITAFEMADAVGDELQKVPGMRAFPVLPQGLGVSLGQPVQFVIGGTDYDELAAWRDVLLDRAAENPGLVNVDADYKETKPQLGITVLRERAGDLGVSVTEIGRTLETMMGSRDVTTYIDRGEEYEVVLESREADRREKQDLTNLYVRSQTSGELVPLSSLIDVREYADAAVLGRFNRMRAITISASLAEGYTLDEALTFLEEIVAVELGGQPGVDYKGESREFRESTGSLLFAFGFALLVVFLVLAAQFESFILPGVIMLTVPLALTGGFIGLLLSGQTVNVYSQIGTILLIGLATKNGILIVEFANQLRDAGRSVVDAALEGSVMRLRPVLMTTISTAVGAIPLAAATGAGAESRMAIGMVIVCGVLFSAAITLFVVPVLYAGLGRYTDSVHAVEQRLELELERLSDISGTNSPNP
ncbi:multidrug transporter AcrB [Oceanidesulfovibrio indonesiensis]|uniref:Multidrug transporter AcrB n=1 Tax=Oceanidesulfovibrio indonesiensis TaxID=54767 RepID=A0A7M3MBP5_9BACT|nr:efflux RND transporter permease subunit [Oceanidesulfovibrio indonesiensis]TVM15162.1 multidrug transporter AcrB [Oceanidesulfovibrio indonesiensis]